MAEPELVGDKDAPAKPAPDPKGGGEKPAAKPDRDYDKELSDLRAQVTEYQQAAQHWYSKAQGILPGETQPDDEDEEPAPKSRKSAKDEEEDDDADTYVAKLTTKGPKAIDERVEKILRQRGFVSREEMEQVIDKERKRFTDDAKLYSLYPDLQDEQSELFKATAAEYKEMVSLDPKLSKSQAAIHIAAKIAKSKLQAAKPNGDAEAERRQRIQAQMGDLGTRGGDFEGEEDDLSPGQKDMIRKFNEQGGIQITEDALKKRLRSGVNMIYTPKNQQTRRAG